ncbi:MAG: glycosyltransferase family 2 protein [bacterium]|nr:glycosyltransferase family 2 protein [bacterium]
MTTSVIIPNWRGRKLLARNLPVVLKCGFDEVIVVDDASPDDSLSFLEREFPQVKVIKHKTNRGFSQSVNDGVKVASGDIVFLLNLDVVPQGDIIESVVKHFQKNENVFGVSLHEKGFGWSRPTLAGGFIAHLPGRETKDSHKTFWVSGGSGAFRKSLWDKLGGMDTLFSPFYWEDVDLSYRALRRGLKLIWEPEAMVLHKHESIINTEHFNPKKLFWIKDRNQLLFTWKHLTAWELISIHLPGLLKRLTKPGYWIVLLMALSRLPQLMKGRIIEGREAKLSNAGILQQFSKT